MLDKLFQEHYPLYQLVNLLCQLHLLNISECYMALDTFEIFIQD